MKINIKNKKTGIFLVAIVLIFSGLLLIFQFLHTTRGTNTKEEITLPTAVIFHNGQGPMCINAIEFFEENNYPYEQHLTQESDFTEKLNEYKAASPLVSEGMSTMYGYYPLIFIENRAFSGFNNEIRDELVNIFEHAI